MVADDKLRELDRNCLLGDLKLLDDMKEKLGEGNFDGVSFLIKMLLGSVNKIVSESESIGEEGKTHFYLFTRGFASNWQVLGERVKVDELESAIESTGFYRTLAKAKEELGGYIEKYYGEST